MRYRSIASVRFFTRSIFCTGSERRAPSAKQRANLKLNGTITEWFRLRPIDAQHSVVPISKRKDLFHDESLCPVKASQRGKVC